MTYTATISIAIYYDADKCLKLVLESILRDGVDPKTLQLIICDDCCPAGRPAIESIIDSYRDRFGEIIYLRHDEHLGFRKTFLLKQAVELADSEIYIFFDGDTVFTGRVLSRMIRAARTHNALCQGQRVYLSHHCIDWGLRHLDSIKDFAVLKDHFYVDNTKTRKNKGRHRESMQLESRGHAGRWLYASGYLMALRTDLTKKIGIVPGIQRGYLEDTDFAKRLFEQEKIDVHEVRNAEVLHLYEHH